MSTKVATHSVWLVCLEFVRSERLQELAGPLTGRRLRLSGREEFASQHRHRGTPCVFLAAIAIRLLCPAVYPFKTQCTEEYNNRRPLQQTRGVFFGEVQAEWVNTKQKIVAP